MEHDAHTTVLSRDGIIAAPAPLLLGDLFILLHLSLLALVGLLLLS